MAVVGVVVVVVAIGCGGRWQCEVGGEVGKGAERPAV